MTFDLFQKYGKSLGALVAFSVLSVGILSTVHFGMNDMSSHDPYKKTENCPFAGATHNICGQGILPHLSAWQGLLAVLPLGATITLFMLLASLPFVYFSLISLWKFQPIPISPIQRKDYARSIPLTPLEEALSNGILNPKLF